jgi:hypothetical protein
MATVRVRIVILTVRITLSVCPFNRMAHTANSTCRAGRGRRSETRFRKIEGEVCPGFPLRAMSHADVISGALT